MNAILVTNIVETDNTLELDSVNFRNESLYLHYGDTEQFFYKY